MDAHILVDYIETARRNGLDIRLRVTSEDEAREMLDEGIAVLSSDDLGATFAFVKLDGGKGIFGGQKGNFLSYVDSMLSGYFTAGPSFRSFVVALTSINNIYRAAGLLAGSAL
jgi:hypothetical protein